MSAPNSRFGSFLENYNKENTFVISSVNRFIDQIATDKTRIITLDSGFLKEKFTYLSETLSDTKKSSYDKALFTGSFLADVAPDILRTTDKEIKKSGINIINSFLDLAKTTEDEQLLNNAMRIADNFKLQ